MQHRIACCIVPDSSRQATDDVVFIDLGSEDETAILVEEIGCKLLTCENDDILSVSRCLKESNLEQADNYLFIHINKQWSLREFPLHLNRSRENWDVYIGLVSSEDEDELTSEQKSSRLLSLPTRFGEPAGIG